MPSLASVSSDSLQTVVIEPCPKMNHQSTQVTQNVDCDGNQFRSNCCRSKISIDKRLLGFSAHLAISFTVLVFSMVQINKSDGENLPVYYAMIGSILGAFCPSYFDRPENLK